MKNIFIPLVSMLIGLAAGYGIWAERAVPSAPNENVANQKAASTGPHATPQAGKSAPAKPVAALGDLMAELLKDYDYKAAQKTAANLSAEELKSALALLAAKPRSSTRDSLRAVLYQAWATQDFQAAWKAALADPLDTRGALTGAVAGVLAKSNPKAALELVQGMGMGGRRTNALGSVMAAWSKADVVAATEYALQHPELMSGYSVSFTADLARLAQKDPLKAAALTLRFKEESRRTSSLGGLMESWVENDPKAAFNWAISQTNPKLRQEAVAAAVSAWSKTDPKAALAYVESIPDGEVRQESFKKAWGDWFKNDPLAAVDHLKGIKDDKMLDNVRFYLSYYTDGYSATERGQVLSQLPNGEFKNKVMDSMSDVMIRKGNYNGAMELLNEIPDSSSRDRNVAKLSSEWATNDPAAVSDWLKKLPDSTDRDLAIAGFARTLARSDPSAAIAQVNEIPDATLRSSALSSIAAIWMRTDAKAAQAWLSGNSGISDNDRRMIDVMGRFSSGSSALDHIAMPLRVGTRR